MPKSRIPMPQRGIANIEQGITNVEGQETVNRKGHAYHPIMVFLVPLVQTDKTNKTVFYHQN
jgi:hypothetical protein